MKDWKAICLGASATIIEAMRVIDSGSQQLALVVDDEMRLQGTVSDGDVRRGILRGLSLDTPVSEVMRSSPRTIRLGEGRLAALSKMRQLSLRHIPVVDAEGRVLDLLTQDELLAATPLPNAAVLMAGGLGLRLGPLTRDCPKPLLKVGGKPILEIILESLVEAGVQRVFLSVNYRAEMIEAHFGDGARWGCDVRYLREDERLGTAGALSLLPERPAHPLLVMNGDILTRLDFRQLLAFHEERMAPATMVVREHEILIPYGVVATTPEQRLTALEEKPVRTVLINAGIYVLSPRALEHIPGATCFDMPDLFRALIDRGEPPAVYQTREYWLDIGHQGDYQRAVDEFGHIFGAEA